MKLSAILAGTLAFLIALVAISYIVEALRPAPGRPDKLAWAPDVPIQYANLGGTKVRYIRTGAGPNLVLLHTLRTQLDIFQGLIPQLAQQFTVYAYDYPGHGWSDIPEASYAPEDFYKWTTAFLDKLEIRHATVAGVSIGATIALVLAARNNPRVARVVAVNSYEVLWTGRLGRLKKLVERKKEKAAMTDDAPPAATLLTFNIEQQVDLKASPAGVFRSLMLDIGEWWGAPHLRDDARDVVLDPVPGGLVKQVTRDGGGNVMFMVQAVRRDRLLVLHGTMGIPKMVHMTVRFELEPTKGGTRLRLEHWAIGDREAAATGDDFVKGWQDLLGSRLRANVETGKSSGVRAK